MKTEKILWIVILVLFIVAVVLGVVFLKPKDNANSVPTLQKGTVANDRKVGNTTYQKVELDDGVLYSATGEKVEADMVIGDNYFDTTMNDMMINFDKYKGKKIEIEGMYLENGPYTFVGRYSTSNLCQYCPTGYSYMEYELDGEIDKQFTNEKEWIKVVGTFEKGQDNYGTEEKPDYQDYYYIKVLSLQVMNERGQETVNN